MSNIPCFQPRCCCDDDGLVGGPQASQALPRRVHHLQEDCGHPCPAPFLLPLSGTRGSQMDFWARQSKYCDIVDDQFEQLNFSGNNRNNSSSVSSRQVDSVAEQYKELQCSQPHFPIARLRWQWLFRNVRVCQQWDQHKVPKNPLGACAVQTLGVSHAGWRRRGGAR